LGGVSLFVKDNVVYYEINAYANRSGQLVASEPLKPGKSHLELAVTPSAANGAANIAFTSRKASEGDAVLKVNGQAAGQAHFVNVNVSPGETFDIGSDLGSPVSSEYKSPNRFTGKIDLVTVELK
jgi:arylsulfatase